MQLACGERRAKTDLLTFLVFLLVFNSLFSSLIADFSGSFENLTATYHLEKRPGALGLCYPHKTWDRAQSGCRPTYLLPQVFPSHSVLFCPCMSSILSPFQSSSKEPKTGRPGSYLKFLGLTFLTECGGWEQSWASFLSPEFGLFSFHPSCCHPTLWECHLGTCAIKSQPVGSSLCASSNHSGMDYPQEDGPGGDAWALQAGKSRV